MKVNPPHTTPINPLPEWHRNPFPKPRTIPDGWDTSDWHVHEHTARSSTNPAEPAPDAGEASPTARPDWYNPFPKPRTIPDGWDTDGWY